MSYEGPYTPTHELRQIALDAAALFELPEGWQDNRSVRQGFAIDAAYSQDIDDAVGITPTPGGHILHVSIADVGSFLARNKDIGLYAQRKMHTTYHNNRPSIPMLPPRISEDILSLVDGQPRPVLTTHIPVSKAGKIGQVCFTREVMVARRIAFDEVDSLAEDDPTLQGLETLARRLFAARHGLTAANPEDIIVVEDEEGQALSLGEYSTGQFIVSEAMIALNAAVAHYAQRHHIPVIYRNHTIPPDMLPEIVEPHERALILGALATASYGARPEGHTGLNLKEYVPFSSPLRRFVDFVNHCNLVAYFENQPYPYSPARIEKIIARINHFQQVGKQPEGRILRAENILARFTRAQNMIMEGTAGPGELADALFGKLPANEERKQELRIRAAQFLAANIHLARPTFDVVLARGYASLNAVTPEGAQTPLLTLEDTEGNRYPYPRNLSPLRRGLALSELAGRIAGTELTPVIPEHLTREGRILANGERFLARLSEEGRLHYRRWQSPGTNTDGSVTMFASVRLNQKYYERSATAPSRKQALRKVTAELIRELDLIANLPHVISPNVKNKPPEKSVSQKDDPRIILHARMHSGGGANPQYTYDDYEPGKLRRCTVTIVDFDGTPYTEVGEGRTRREAQQQAANALLAKIPKRPTKKPKHKDGGASAS